MRSKLLLLAVLAVVPVLPAAAQDGPPPPRDLDGEIVLEGLNGPQGVFVDSEGNLWVADGGIGGEEEIEYFNPNTWAVTPATLGNTSRIIRVNADGKQEVIATAPSVAVAEDFMGAARIAELDGTVYVTVGGWHINLGEEVSVPLHSHVVRLEDGEAVSVANLWPHELATNPDETSNIEAHPYGITAGPDGLLYVADAAANALFTVDLENGEVATVAAFPGQPGVFPASHRDGEMIADPVPTAVAFDDEGNTYVSYLSGAPFVPGSAKVVKVSADGEISDYATGLTMLTDLRYAPDGNLYAVQFSLFTQEGPEFNSGKVIRILDDGSAEVVIDGLPFATSLAFDADGNGYVAINGAAIPEAGMVVYYEGLTAMEGQPMPEMEAEMGG